MGNVVSSMLMYALQAAWFCQRLIDQDYRQNHGSRLKPIMDIDETDLDVFLSKCRSYYLSQNETKVDKRKRCLLRCEKKEEVRNEIVQDAVRQKEEPRTEDVLRIEKPVDEAVKITGRVAPDLPPRLERWRRQKFSRRRRIATGRSLDAMNCSPGRYDRGAPSDSEPETDRCESDQHSRVQSDDRVLHRDESRRRLRRKCRYPRRVRSLERSADFPPGVGKSDSISRMDQEALRLVMARGCLNRPTEL